MPLSPSFGNKSKDKISPRVATYGPNGFTQPLTSFLLSLRQLERLLAWYAQGDALI
jgi:hypothetical protein